MYLSRPTPDRHYKVVMAYVMFDQMFTDTCKWNPCECEGCIPNSKPIPWDLAAATLASRKSCSWQNQIWWMSMGSIRYITTLVILVCSIFYRQTTIRTQRCSWATPLSRKMLPMTRCFLMHTWLRIEGLWGLENCPYQHCTRARHAAWARASWPCHCQWIEVQLPLSCSGSCHAQVEHTSKLIGHSHTWQHRNIAYTRSEKGIAATEQHQDIEVDTKKQVHQVTLLKKCLIFHLQLQSFQDSNKCGEKIVLLPDFYE